MEGGWTKTILSICHPPALVILTAWGDTVFNQWILLKAIDQVPRESTCLA